MYSAQGTRGGVKFLQLLLKLIVLQSIFPDPVTSSRSALVPLSWHQPSQMLRGLGVPERLLDLGFQLELSGSCELVCQLSDGLTFKATC
ncbi:hypothetical protein AKJ16_DCAP27024 [Drosera capensis]